MVTMATNSAKKSGSVMKGAATKPKKEANFKGRRATIKKKTMELSVLCDVKACAIIVDQDGNVETWPQNSREVLELIRAYRNSGGNNVVEFANEESDRGAQLDQEPVITAADVQELEEMLLLLDDDSDHGEQRGFPRTLQAEDSQEFLVALDYPVQEKQKLPIMFAATNDEEEERGFPRMINNGEHGERHEWANASDHHPHVEKESELTEGIERLPDWDCFDDQTALFQPLFDDRMNADSICFDDYCYQVNPSDWLADYQIEQAVFTLS